MKKPKSKKQSDSDFMAKLKSLNFVTKSEQSALSALAEKHGAPEYVTHPETGEKMKLVAAKEAECGCVLGLFHQKHKRKKHDESGEQEFAA